MRRSIRDLFARRFRIARKLTMFELTLLVSSFTRLSRNRGLSRSRKGGCSLNDVVRLRDTASVRARNVFAERLTRCVR